MMEELNKTNRLTITVIIIVLVIITGLITFRRPEVKFTLSPAESLALLNDSNTLVTPLQASVLLKDSSGKILFVDVRNSIDFERGHIQNSINIPVRELYSKKNKVFFHDLKKSGQTAILYGTFQQQANGPWLILRQTGTTNVKLFTGSYVQLTPDPDSLVRLLPQLSETSLVDTAAIKALQSPNTTASKKDQQVKPVKKQVVPVKQEASSGGGC